MVPLALRDRDPSCAAHQDARSPISVANKLLLRAKQLRPSLIVSQATLPAVSTDPSDASACILLATRELGRLASHVVKQLLVKQ